MRAWAFILPLCGILAIAGGCEKFSSCKDGQNKEFNLNLTNTSPDLLQSFQISSNDGELFNVYKGEWAFENLCPSGVIYLDVQFSYKPLPENFAEFQLRFDNLLTVPPLVFKSYGKTSTVYECPYVGKPDENATQMSLTLIFKTKFTDLSMKERSFRDMLDYVNIDLSYVTAN